jgi:hypothetical protein
MKRKNEERQAFDPAPFIGLMVLVIVSGLGMVGLCLYKFFQYREIYQSREFWVAFSVFLGVVVALMLLSLGLRWICLQFARWFSGAVERERSRIDKQFAAKSVDFIDPKENPMHDPDLDN